MPGVSKGNMFLRVFLRPQRQEFSLRCLTTRAHHSTALLGGNQKMLKSQSSLKELVFGKRNKKDASNNALLGVLSLLVLNCVLIFNILFLLIRMKIQKRWVWKRRWRCHHGNSSTLILEFGFLLIHHIEGKNSGSMGGCLPSLFCTSCWWSSLCFKYDFTLTNYF